MARDEYMVKPWSFKGKTEEIIDAAKEGLDILIEAIREPIDLEQLTDDKVRAAVQAKKISLLDAITFLKEIEGLMQAIGQESKGSNLKEEKTWEGNPVEKRIKGGK